VWSRKLKKRGNAMMKFHVRAVTILLVAIVTCVPDALAGLSISPAFVETNLDAGRPSGQFIVSNLGDEEERYRIKAVHFVFQRDGALRRMESDQNSLVPWIKFNPTEFTLGPKTRRAIRYVIVPNGPLKKGEYWAAMELESLKTTMGSGKDTAGREYQLEVIPSIMVPIFARYGSVRYEGAIKDAVLLSTSDGGQHMRLLLANTGEGRLLMEGDYDILDSSGRKVAQGQFGKFYIMPGMERIADCMLKTVLPEGSYKVKVNCRSPQLKEPLKEELSLAPKPPG
jgi:hypothetical protein